MQTCTGIERKRKVFILNHPLVCRNTPIEKPSIVQTVDDSQDVFKKLAIPIPAEELYDIFTRSNELIQIVDARSEEEYKEAHISAAKSLVFDYVDDYVGKF